MLIWLSFVLFYSLPFHPLVNSLCTSILAVYEILCKFFDLLIDFVGFRCVEKWRNRSGDKCRWDGCRSWSRRRQRNASAEPDAQSTVQCVDHQQTNRWQHAESRVPKFLDIHQRVRGQEPFLLSGWFDLQKPCRMDQSSEPLTFTFVFSLGWMVSSSQVTPPSAETADRVQCTTPN